MPPASAMPEISPAVPPGSAPTWGGHAAQAVDQAKRDYRRAMNAWATNCLRLRALGLDRPRWTPQFQSGVSR